MDKADPIVLRCAKNHPLVLWTAKRSEPESRACPICQTMYLPPKTEDR